MVRLKIKSATPILSAIQGWYPPPKWMGADIVDFRYRIVEIDGKIYTEYSEEFATKFNENRIMLLLTQ